MRILKNLSDFIEQFPKQWEELEEKFCKAVPCEEDKNMIIIMYDEEGYCFFEYDKTIEDVELWEFTSTGK